jgi:hypothetical protein
MSAPDQIPRRVAPAAQPIAATVHHGAPPNLRSHGAADSPPDIVDLVLNLIGNIVTCVADIV